MPLLLCIVESFGLNKLNLVAEILKSDICVKLILYGNVLSLSLTSYLWIIVIIK